MSLSCLYLSVFAVFVSVCNCLLPHSIGEQNIVYSKLTTIHNSRNSEILPSIGDSNYTAYAGYDIPNITNLLSKQSWKDALDVRGDFSPFISRLNHKLTSARYHTENVFINVLYIGGSVCVGHGCYPLPLNASDHGLTAEMILKANFHCSWPHRFTVFLQHMLAKFTSVTSPIEGARPSDSGPGAGDTLSRVRVSPRYCCRAATSSNTGMDILLTRAYAKKSEDCGGQTSDINMNDDWEPDLVIWDYSVNDMHSQV